MFGSGTRRLISTAHTTLRRCWEINYCDTDSKTHIKCSLCDDSTWQDLDIETGIPESSSATGDQGADLDGGSSGEGTGTDDLQTLHLSGTEGQSILNDCSPVHAPNVLVPQQDAAEALLSQLRERDEIIAAKEKEIQDLRNELGLKTTKKTNSQTHEEVDQNQPQCTEENLANSGSKYTCQLCSHQYKHHRDLLKHYKSNHEGEVYEHPKSHSDFGCTLCGKVYREEMVLKHHIKTVHNAPLCQFCKKPQTHLRRHEKRCEGRKGAGKRA